MRHTASMLCSFAMLSAGAVQAQFRGLAYSVDSDVSDRLWAIDLTSGQSAAIGATGFEAIEALACHPDGRLFGIDEKTQRLVLLDLTNGSAEVIGDLGVETVNPGFTIDSTGAAWLASDDLKSGSQPFFSVDLETGEATFIGELGADIQGLTAIGRTLYGVNDEEPGLYRIDPKQGVATLVAALGAPFTGACPSVEAAPNGALIALNDNGALFTIDPVTGAATTLSTTLIGLESLAIPLKQVCAYSVDSDVSDQLFKIDLLTGASIAIGSTGIGDIEGLAFHSDGRLFGVDDVTNQLCRIDLRTGSATAIGALGITLRNPGFAISPIGQAFAGSDTLNGPIHSIDLATGVGTLVGDSNETIIGLAFLGSDLLGVAFSNNRLVRIDTANASATVIGDLINVGVSCGGMDTASDGTLWVLSDSGQILAVSPATGAGVFVASTITGCEGLAIPPGCGADVFDLQVTELEFVIETIAAAEGNEHRSIEADLVVPFFGLPEDLSGFAVQLFGNDASLSPTIALDEKGRGRSEPGVEPAYDVALNAKKRTLSIEATGGDVRSAFGLGTASGSGSKVVRVRAHLYPAIDSPNPLFRSSALIPIAWETVEGIATSGGYAPKSDGPNYTGVAVATQAKATEVDGSAHDISFKGTALPNGGGALIPLHPSAITLQPSTSDGGGLIVVRLKVGDAEAIPIGTSSILVSGKGSKSKWSLDKQGPEVPGLTKLSYSAAKGALSFTLDDITATGIPLVATDGDPLTHALPIEISVRTEGGWQTFGSTYVLARKDATSGSWK